ncbi:hypothetical protein C1752_03776 [Acaryochloris thomasi RCC1774]|uniref:Uncharacterized protein n=1 Tax=Acaryochloris thomasi RCC1774 TaxID=1764569 RepID=A0A2W1JEI2_9CYAN|nr:hypothetical protein [Acaryochloris thomasi]PZD72190.1 hypothetical protein C1752_03776 [Acaryochloris thomasi RCC1774]
MSKPDFNSMAKSELRAYVIAHPDDKTAFSVFVDRFTADASPETFDVPQSKSGIEKIDNLIQQKVQQIK